MGSGKGQSKRVKISTSKIAFTKEEIENINKFNSGYYEAFLNPKNIPFQLKDYANNYLGDEREKYTEDEINFILTETIKDALQQEWISMKGGLAQMSKDNLPIQSRVPDTLDLAILKVIKNINTPSITAEISFPLNQYGETGSNVIIRENDNIISDKDFPLYTSSDGTAVIGIFSEKYINNNPKYIILAMLKNIVENYTKNI